MGHDSQAGYKNSVPCPTTWFCTPVQKVLTSKNDNLSLSSRSFQLSNAVIQFAKKPKKPTHALLLYLRVRWTELGQGQKKGMKTLHYAEML